MNQAASDQQARDERHVAIWLLCVCAAIFIMLVLGGATRLTHSGLSMMTWDPLMGWIPPLTDAQWQESFEHYKKIPEFYELNPDMDVEGYKGIFLLEYVHRVWGRLIGLIFLLPFLYYLAKGKISRAMAPKMATMFALGGLQGVLGWYMVSSGFDSAYVSQYRLTAHLLAAFVIFAYIFWVAMGMLYPRSDTTHSDQSRLRRITQGITTLIIVTVSSGGLVAGMKAGFAYNTFPLMEGRFIPEGYGMLSPFYMNFFDNIPAVQFDHRWLAILTLIVVALLWFYGRGSDVVARGRMGLNLLLGMTVIQVTLGISALLLAVPVWLGVTHQGGAMVLFAIALFTLHALRRPRSM